MNPPEINVLPNIFFHFCEKSYQSNALVDPWAMVVELFDTIVTYSTVAASRGPINLADSTIFYLHHGATDADHPAPCPNTDAKFFQRRGFVPCNNSWVSGAGQDQVDHNLFDHIPILVLRVADWNACVGTTYNWSEHRGDGRSDWTTICCAICVGTKDIVGEGDRDDG